MLTLNTTDIWFTKYFPWNTLHWPCLLSTFSFFSIKTLKEGHADVIISTTTTTEEKTTLASGYKPPVLIFPFLSHQAGLLTGPRTTGLVLSTQHSRWSWPIWHRSSHTPPIIYSLSRILLLLSIVCKHSAHEVNIAFTAVHGLYQYTDSKRRDHQIAVKGWRRKHIKIDSSANVHVCVCVKVSTQVCFNT